MGFINTIATMLMSLQNTIYSKVSCLDGVPLLGIRLFLAPVLIVAGWTKFENLSAITMYFGDTLNIPFAAVMTPLAAGTELVGGIMLLFGIATRLIAIPVAATMLVAALTAHLGNGWFAIAPTSAEHSPARVVALIGLPVAVKSQKQADENANRVAEIRKVVDRHPRAEWIKAGGRPVLLQSGIEYAITYLIMLLVLCFYGGGRYVSVDHYICQNCTKKK